MDKDFKHGQRPRLRQINNRDFGTVPPSAKSTRSLSAERRGCMPALGDALRVHQEKTPCSTRPIRFSTSRAPDSILEYIRGVSPSRGFLGVVSHLTADATSPSNSSTALSKTIEIRRRRSHSSGANLPAVLRRASVLSGMARIETIKFASTPEFDSNFRRASKGKPTSNCSINSAVPPDRIPRLAPRLRKRDSFRADDDLRRAFFGDGLNKALLLALP